MIRDITGQYVLFEDGTWLFIPVEFMAVKCGDYSWRVNHTDMIDWPNRGLILEREMTRAIVAESIRFLKDHYQRKPNTPAAPLA